MSSDFDLFADFSLAAEVGVALIDQEGNKLFASELYRQAENLLDSLSALMQNREQCQISMIYGSYQSYRFGGRYIFFCPRGLVHFASPLTKGGQMSSCAIAGPLLMTDRDDYLELDIARKHSLSPGKFQELHEALKVVPVIDPQRVRAMSEQLYLCSRAFSGELLGPFERARKSQALQSDISQYISQIKNDEDTGFYPLEKESALLAAMSRGDAPAAKALLNEILGHVLFQSGFRLEIMRSRVLELMVLLSRAAVKGGADVELVFGLNYSYLQEIDRFKDIEELTFWLSEIMNRFTQYVFHFADAKHVDIIFKVIDYMRRNYMRKLTLEDAATHVYLSASYLSKLFKDATGYNFNSYLNMLRIEESKKLLRNANTPLVDVSNLVGYEDQSYFTKVFKKIEGVSPGKYRQSILIQ